MDLSLTLQKTRTRVFSIWLYGLAVDGVEAFGEASNGLRSLSLRAPRWVSFRPRLPSRVHNALFVSSTGWPNCIVTGSKRGKASFS